MRDVTAWNIASEVGPRIWTAEKWSRQGWHWRSVAVSLGDDALAIYSPIRDLGEDAHASLRALGTPAYLIAPNHFHHLGLAEYVQHHDGCRVACSDAARPRLEKKTGMPLVPLSELAGRLPDHVELLTPPGLKNGEVWLRVAHAGRVAWVVSDAFFNVAVNPSGLMGLVLRMTGTTPNLRIGRTFTGLVVGDRGAYRSWLLAALDADRPSVLVPGHGAIEASNDLAQRLTDLVRERIS